MVGIIGKIFFHSAWVFVYFCTKKSPLRSDFFVKKDKSKNEE